MITSSFLSSSKLDYLILFFKTLISLFLLKSSYNPLDYVSNIKPTYLLWPKELTVLLVTVVGPIPTLLECVLFYCYLFKMIGVSLLIEPHV